MSRRFTITSVITISLIFLNTSQAGALFGSECREPKSAYKSAISKFNTDKPIYKKLTEKAQSQRAKLESNCVKNPDPIIAKNKARWNSNVWGLEYFCFTYAFDATSWPKMEDPIKNYKRAMEIVVNYKKCFKPDEFLDAKEWLLEN